jgi:hypothetical protein
MAATPPAVSLYATRWKPFLAALVFAEALTVDLLWYLVWPTPMISEHSWEYHEPAKTIVFIVVFVLGAAITLLALYWAFTPLPMLELTTSSFIYRPFPLPKRVIQWSDVEHISAHARKRPVNLIMDRTILTFTFSLNAHGALAAGESQRIEIDIVPGVFSRRPEALVRLLREYHPVQFYSDPTNAKARKRKK